MRMKKPGSKLSQMMSNHLSMAGRKGACSHFTEHTETVLSKEQGPFSLLQDSVLLYPRPAPPRNREGKNDQKYEQLFLRSPVLSPAWPRTTRITSLGDKYGGIFSTLQKETSSMTTNFAIILNFCSHVRLFPLPFFVLLLSYRLHLSTAVPSSADSLLLVCVVTF